MQAMRDEAKEFTRAGGLTASLSLCDIDELP
jgi:hypothetical protein